MYVRKSNIEFSGTAIEQILHFFSKRCAYLQMLLSSLIYFSNKITGHDPDAEADLLEFDTENFL